MEKPKRTQEEKDFLTKFGESLCKFRKEINLTQGDLAEKAGMSTTIISDYERGEKAASIWNAKQLADVLGVTMDSLCGIDKEIQEQNRLENMPILAILAVLKQFKAQVHVAESKITLTISSDNDRIKHPSKNDDKSYPSKDDGKIYSSKEILNFFREYEMIQAFADSANKNDLGNDMIELLLSNLRQKYKHLPGLPEYKFSGKQKKTSP